MSISKAYLESLDKKYNKVYGKLGLEFKLAEGKGVASLSNRLLDLEKDAKLIQDRLIGKIIKPFASIHVSNDKAFMFLEGGRAGGKSYSVAYLLIAISFNKTYKNKIFLCIRKVQESIETSSYALLKKIILDEGLDSYFKITEREILNLVTGVTFLFKGVNNQSNLVSIKSFVEAIVIWVEEAEAITVEDLKIIIPTFVRFKGFKFIFTFNRFLEEDPIYLELKKRKDSSLHIYSTYKENPLAGEDVIREAEECRRISEAEYNHIWLGLPGGRYIAFPKLKQEHNAFDDKYFKFDEHPWYIAMDWGFFPDFCAVGFYCLYENKVIIKFDEMKFNQKTPQEAAATILDRMSWYNQNTYVTGFVDPSVYRRHSSDITIGDELAASGLVLQRANNNREMGYQRMRRLIDTQQFLISPTCKYFWNTIPNIVMSDKKPGDIMQDNIDDHAYDETRYALMGIITGHEVN